MFDAPSLATLLAFGAASAALLALPGPSVAFVVARALEHGRRAGLLSALGLEIGASVHVLLAAAGITALLAASSWALPVIRYVGAAYLVTIGIRQLLVAPRPDLGRIDPTPTSSLRLLRDGVLVDLLNPKTALFFLAFLPQFVDPAGGPVGSQVAALGLVFVLLAAVVDGGYALTAAALRPRLSASAGAQRLLRRGTGVIYCGLGGLAVFA